MFSVTPILHGKAPQKNNYGTKCPLVEKTTSMPPFGKSIGQLGNNTKTHLFLKNYNGTTPSRTDIDIDNHPYRSTKKPTRTILSEWVFMCLRIGCIPLAHA